jgi:hypothetical protein
VTTPSDTREFSGHPDPDWRESNSPKNRPPGDSTPPARRFRRRPSPAHDAAYPSGGAPGAPSLRLVDVALFYGERSAGAIHELPAVRASASNGYRRPLSTRALTTVLRRLAPDVLLQHDPSTAPSTRALGELVWTFEPGDVDGTAHRREPVFRAELAGLERLAGVR